MRIFFFFLQLILLLSCEHTEITLHSINLNVNSSDDEIFILDPALKKCIKLNLKILPEEPITMRDVDELFALECPAFYDDEVIYSLDGIEIFENLKSVNFDGCQISDLYPMEYLTQMQFISMRNNNVRDLYPLRLMHNLVTLHLDGNEIDTIVPLLYKTNLDVLTLSNNYIRSIDYLHLMPIYNLDVSNNFISDINRLSVNAGLKDINLSGNNISDISVFEYFGTDANIWWLDLSNNRISDVLPLRKLINTSEINLSDNRIIDVSPLRQLIELRTLDVSNNCIASFESLDNLPATIESDNQNTVSCFE